MLHIHRAQRADGLVEGLRALLAQAPDDPFAAEVVAVPTRGMERWLAQRLADRLGARAGRADGICANVEFPSPRRLVTDALAAATAIDPDDDPWPPERAVWPLLEVVDACLHEDWLHVLAAHLGATAQRPDPARRARRFAVVRHVAELFDRYAHLRPELVRAWAAGGDDGSPWQAELWRRLRARLAVPDLAERLDGGCARLRAGAGVAALPQRLSLFGLTRLPAAHLEVLDALAARRDVHLFVLHPSPALWSKVAAAPPPATLRRRDDVTADLPVNRLLGSWGQDARELQVVLRSAAGDAADHHHAVAQPSGTLLAALQAGVHADAEPPGAPLPGEPDRRMLIESADESVQVHACHGRARQVEVVRDAILHLLARDPTLEPRDVVVMCPGIESFAPLVHATFGGGRPADDDEDDADAPADGDRPPDLRVRLADRSLRQTNPVLGVVAQLLDLADARLTASEVLDLAGREPVRRRFGLDDDDLARLEEWVGATGIRWGLDAAHRAPFALQDLPAGTWRAGLDRVLVGVTMTEEPHDLFAGVLPLDDVESGAVDLAGRLAELVDRLGTAVDALAAPKPLDAWVDAVAVAADALTSTGQRDAWQRAELDRILDDLAAEARAGGAALDTELTLPEARALLGERLQGRPTRANFRTGHLTVCTLMPMRSVPHRVVCLLGMDDGVFPRKAPRDGDDLVLDDPHVGDRDPRSEDRQLLLDALLAATDRLVVTYTGNDERTNTPQPPAVPVGELLDVVDATARTPDGRPARERVRVTHPLQPFDPRNFVAGALARGRAWSFDRIALDGARALARPRTEPAAFLAAPLPPLDASLVELEDLVRFVEHPCRAFLRQRLGIGLGTRDDEVDDALPVELDPLQQWAVGERLIAARLAGTDRRSAILAELARGTLPPGLLGRPVVEAVEPEVEAIVAAAKAVAGGPDDAGSADVRVELGGGRSLHGTVAGVCGDVLRVVSYSRVSARHRLALWVRFLALTAAWPQRDVEAALVGRAPRDARGGGVRIVRLRVLAGDAATRRDRAVAHLGVLVDLRDRGLREPLPLACRASAAYAAAAATGGDPAGAAREEWASSWNRDKEDRDLEHQLVHGGTLELDELLGQAPRDDERGDGWGGDERSRFGRYARRLWEPLLAHEEVEDQ